MRRFFDLVFALGCLALALTPGATSATTIEVVESPGGLTAWLVREPAIPVISLKFAFKGGGALDPVGKEGLANLVSGLLDEGAGELESLAFQTRLEELAVRLSFSADRDDFYGNLRTLSRNRDAAFELLQLAIEKPRFDSVPVERVRRQIIVGLTHDLEDPGAIAGRHWFKTVFQAHPYWHPTDGTLAGVKAITPADLHGFVERRFARDNLLIAVVGDIDAAALGPLLDRTFGGLPEKSSPGAIAEARLELTPGLHVIRKDIPQSTIFLGMPGMRRDDPDWYVARLMNYILGGGGQSSKLYEEVREKRGLAYSVYSYLLPFDSAALFLGGAGTQNSRVKESLETIRAVLVDLRENGVSEEDLANAKTYINGSFPLRLTSSSKIAGLLLAMRRLDLGLDYLDRRAGIFNRITLDDVSRVAKRLLKPESMYVVIVGDPDGF